MTLKPCRKHREILSLCHDSGIKGKNMGGNMHCNSTRCYFRTLDEVCYFLVICIFVKQRHELTLFQSFSVVVGCCEAQ